MPDSALPYGGVTAICLFYTMNFDITLELQELSISIL